MTSLIVLIAAMGTLTACESKTTGKSGELEFRYNADDDLANFNKPIAVGAKLDLRVYDAGTSNKLASVSSASSADENVLKVGKIEGNRVTIEAVGDGSAELSFQTDVGDDAIDMMARVPEVLKTSHLCLDNGEVEGYYIQNQEVFIPFDLELKDGQSVIGYGYYPVKFDNADVSVDASKSLQDFMVVKIGAVDGKVVMSSDVDETKLSLNVVKEAAINGAKLDSDNAFVGEAKFMTVLPTIDNKPICQAKSEFTIEVTSPDLCEVKKLQDDSELFKGTRQYGWIEVKGKVIGDCKFNVTYPKGADGAGATTELTVPIQNK